MRTWLEIEERFKALPEMAYLRLDIQWGSAGEHFSITGMQRTPAVKQFELLCGVAGRILEKALDDNAEPGISLLAEEHPKIRWYRALKDLSGDFQTELPGMEIDEDGKTVGYIHVGTLYHVVAASANLCLMLHANFPVRDSRTIWERVYDDYGREIVIGIIVAVGASAIAAVAGFVFG